MAGDEPGELQSPAAPVCSAHEVILDEPLESGTLSTLPQVVLWLLPEERQMWCLPGMVEVEGTVLCLATVAA